MKKQKVKRYETRTVRSVTLDTLHLGLGAVFKMEEMEGMKKVEKREVGAVDVHILLRLEESRAEQ